MATSTRFAVAVHILTFLSADRGEARGDAADHVGEAHHPDVVVSDVGGLVVD